ncbi:MAG TPA: hypothetical protein VGU01_03955 [Sphingomicrobium sp.]|nr:hypothetical protein [Sphingomicrobium sp.]
MHFVRPAFAEHPMRFGRAPLRSMGNGEHEGSTIAGDIKLFAATFAAGFLFISILIS